MTDSTTTKAAADGYVRELGVLDSTMLVAGSMIGSGIFIVSADIARNVGSTGWLLLSWVVTGLLTIAAAMSFAELASRMPYAGGQYVFLRDLYSPLFGFLFGWAFFLVIQSGTIAAVAVGFAKYLGVLFPAISGTSWIIAPINLSEGYAISLSVQQLVGLVLIVFLTMINSKGIKFGKWIQNAFTSVKTLSLFALILVGLIWGWNSDVVHQNFSNLFASHGATPIKPDVFSAPTLSATDGFLGLLVAMCVAQVGSLFSSDAWNNITFAAGEVKNPSKTIPIALVLGTAIVTLLYVSANLAYAVTLPLEKIQNADQDRVATAALGVIFGDTGKIVMAIAIVISTFGCNNGLVLAGARVTHAMAGDGLFFEKAGKLNSNRVPSIALWLQCLWACLLVLPRIRMRDASGAPLLDANGQPQFGSLYSNLLDYVVFAVLIFYVLTVAGLFIARKRAAAKNEPAPPTKAWGYPIVPLLYILAATTILAALFIYKTNTSWPGLVIVLSGVPVFYLWKRSAGANAHRSA